jgi:hypothetical protein
MWNNREWNNSYYFIGPFNNPSDRLAAKHRQLDYLIVENHTPQLPYQQELLKDYQLLVRSGNGTSLLGRIARH